MNKPVYGISGIGSCVRVLGAQRLGYESPPKSAEDLARLAHYTQMEAIAAKQLEDLGYVLEDGGLCNKCVEERGIERHGIHVEIDTPLFTLMGHLDRRAFVNGHDHPIEIKSAGKSTFDKFKKNQFRDFPGYAFQECCYLEAEQTSGIYYILQRDTGENLKYAVNSAAGRLPAIFKPIELSITFDEIVDKINMVELEALEGKMLPGVEGPGCWFCEYKHLCIKSEEADIKKSIVVTDGYLIQAGENYVKGKEMEEAGKEMKSAAVYTLVNHAKTMNMPKFRAGDMSVTYRGQKTKKWLDQTTLEKAVTPDILSLAKRESAPFDDYTVKKLAPKKIKEDK